MIDEPPPTRERPRRDFDEDENDAFFFFERWQIAVSDPLYGYLIALALSLGLSPLAPGVRYALLWTLLLAMGAGAYLLGGRARTEDAEPANLVWGIGFGLLIGLPAVALVSPALALTSRQLFPEMSDVAVYVMMVFALPLSETAFFRCAIQEWHGARTAGIAAGVWSLLLFVPGRTPAEALAIGIMVFALSFAYTYVRQRNGLAAAWLCQMVVSVLLLFVPRLG